MFDLGLWLYPTITENDPDDFKMPYRLYGKFERELMMGRYMAINPVDKPPFVYPRIFNLLS